MDTQQLRYFLQLFVLRGGDVIYKKARLNAHTKTLCDFVLDLGRDQADLE